MKLTYTKILARKILLAFLAFTILLSITAFFVRNSISKKLENISKLANSVESGQVKPQQALLLLHESENDFQESLLSMNSNKKIEYKAKLSQAFNVIDTLLKENSDTAHLSNTQRSRVKSWYLKKLELSGKLYALKHNFDSLLTVYADFDAARNKDTGGPSIVLNTKKTNESSKVDTIQKVIAPKNKGLFGRLKDAILNKKGPESITTRHYSTKEVTDLSTQKNLEKDKKAYARKFQELQQRNIGLLNKQRELIVLNSKINSELERIIYDVKEINYSMANEFKQMALRSYQETTVLWNKFFQIALLIILVFAILLIVFIIQLNKSEQFLRKENQRSVTMAQQKMDLLQHMSHEIRNPLTAIKGFLYIFSKSNLSQRQMEMLDSIRLSSDMLLRTLNDTLDAAKMENSEFKINNDPFNPDFALRMVIESMEFSSTKKKLTMQYNFKGDKDAIVLGDSFRLNQIMVNLLSNAIKYTSSGGVTVNAELTKENKLHVNVVDTGAGISLEQQSNLFSKYYQTNSSKGQMGTGLGLFICKQLVELHKGKITVKSDLNRGSTFSFFIPYQKNYDSSITKQVIIDPLSLLNGISILAVDDNELSLMFLKMMMSKWNVKFHQAGNGQEALDIISKNAITIVLTDMYMPEMDGHTLLTAIRKLNKPFNNLPVIVVSGASELADEKRILEMGFSGIVGKPFIETELVEQLVKALKQETNRPQPV
jgi:signal transduction histidine kinase/CheY-like chemotaxis protein